MTKLIRICILTVKTMFCKPAVLALSTQMQMFGVPHLACPLSIFPLCLGIQSMMWDWKWLWKEAWLMFGKRQWVCLPLAAACPGCDPCFGPYSVQPCTTPVPKQCNTHSRASGNLGVQGISFPIRDSGLMLWLHFMPGWGTVCCLMRSKGSTSSWWAWYRQETTSTKGKKPYFGHAWR